MAKTPITTEEVKKQNNMAFKMRSGNKVSFKNMGSSPAKQKLNKGGEGQDQNKIFNNKGEHVGDYVNDKPVMRPGFKRPVVKKDKPVKPKDGDYEKYSDLEKYDDDNPTGKAEPPKKSSDKPVKPTDKDMEKYSDLEKYDDDRPVSPNKQKILPQVLPQFTRPPKHRLPDPGPRNYPTFKERNPTELLPTLRTKEFVTPQMHSSWEQMKPEKMDFIKPKTPIIPDYHAVKEKGKKKLISTTPKSDYYDPTYKRRTKVGKLATKAANVFRSDKKDKNVNVRKKKK